MAYQILIVDDEPALQRMVQEILILFPLTVQPDDLQDFPDVFLRNAAKRLDNAQIFLTGQMAVVAGTLDETAHLTQYRQTVAVVHILSQHADAARCRTHQT